MTKKEIRKILDKKMLGSLLTAIKFDETKTHKEDVKRCLTIAMAELSDALSLNCITDNEFTTIHACLYNSKIGR